MRTAPTITLVVVVSMLTMLAPLGDAHGQAGSSHATIGGITTIVQPYQVIDANGNSLGPVLEFFMPGQVQIRLIVDGTPLSVGVTENGYAQHPLPTFGISGTYFSDAGCNGTAYPDYWLYSNYPWSTFGSNPIMFVDGTTGYHLTQSSRTVTVSSVRWNNASCSPTYPVPTTVLIYDEPSAEAIALPALATPLTVK